MRMSRAAAVRRHSDEAHTHKLQRRLSAVDIIHDKDAALFSAIDVDKSGDISIEELRAAMQKENPAVTDAEIQRRWDAMERDHNGIVSKDEWFANAAGRTKKEIMKSKRESIQLEWKHRQLQSMRDLDAGGLELAERFAVACGVRTPPDVFTAARIFRKHKTREFWLYVVFLIVFSASTLQQRPVEETHDFITNTVDATIMTKDKLDHDITDISTISDFWFWMLAVTPQYLYQHARYNGTAVGPDFQGTRWRLVDNNLVVQRVRLRQVRVLREDCEVPRRMAAVAYGGLLANGSRDGTNFKNLDGLSECIPAISDSTVDESGHWGISLVNTSAVKTPVAYKSGDVLGSYAFVAKASSSKTTYEGGGYVRLTTRSASEREREREKEREKERDDPHTRIQVRAGVSAGADARAVRRHA